MLGTYYFSTSRVIKSGDSLPIIYYAFRGTVGCLVAEVSIHLTPDVALHIIDRES